MTFKLSAVPARRLLAAAVLAAALTPSHAITNAMASPGFAAVGRGVQVAPDWVLTSQHYSYAVNDIYFNTYGQRQVLAHYDAPGSGTFPANDLTLLRLAPAAVAVPYLAIDGQVRGDSTFAAIDVTIASDAYSSPQRGYGFTTVTESAIQIDPDDSGPAGPVTVNFLISYDTQTYVQGGDSSGGLFLGHVADSTVLMGITSALLTDENNVPLGSAFVQPAAYRSWIDQTMAADTADNQMLLWTTVAVPEPATWALWGLGCAALLARRRRGAGRG